MLEETCLPVRANPHVALLCPLKLANSSKSHGAFRVITFNHTHKICPSPSWGEKFYFKHFAGKDMLGQ